MGPQASARKAIVPLPPFTTGNDFVASEHSDEALQVDPAPYPLSFAV